MYLNTKGTRRFSNPFTALAMRFTINRKSVCSHFFRSPQSQSKKSRQKQRTNLVVAPLYKVKRYCNGRSSASSAHSLQATENGVVSASPRAITEHEPPVGGKLVWKDMDAVAVADPAMQTTYRTIKSTWGEKQLLGYKLTGRFLRKLLSFGKIMPLFFCVMFPRNIRKNQKEPISFLS